MSEAHSKELLDMCRAHFNEPMLSFGQVVRCIGYGETGIDCYVITKLPGGELGGIRVSAATRSSIASRGKAMSARQVARIGTTSLG